MGEAAFSLLFNARCLGEDGLDKTFQCINTFNLPSIRNYYSVNCENLAMQNVPFLLQRIP